MPPTPTQTRSAAVERERRFIALRDVELRDATATGDGSWTISGYAAVYDTWTTIYEGRGWRLDEQIQKGAFTRVLSEAPDVHLVINHDMSRAIARTGVTGMGGLELTEDAIGLRYFARVDPSDPDVISLGSKLRNGVVDQASFAFCVEVDELVTRTEGDMEIDQRTIIEVDELYDVSVCAQGAYPTTTASLRARAEQHASDSDRTRSGGSHDDIAPSEGVDTAIAARGGSSPRLEAARARAALGRLDHGILKETTA